MSVAVTGGSGVVGRAVVRHLVASGEEVWALARSAGSEGVLTDLGARVVTGDLLDRSALDRLMKGRDVVYHVAGVNEMCSREPERMWRVNVEGTTSALEAARSGGVRRFVLTSSATAIGEESGTVGHERSKHRGYFLSEYERSKTVSERLALDRVTDVEVVAVNPSSVQGPGRSTGTGALFLALARGAPFAVDVTVSVVDIDDCARGHLLAAEHGVPGERYILSGHVVTVREAIGEINRLLTRRSRPFMLKPSVIRTSAPLVESVFRLMGKTPPICPESARVLLHGHRYDGTRASRDLGLDYTPLRDSLARTIDWFTETGLM